MRNKLKYILLGSLLAGLLHAADQRPNLLVLLSDDQRADTLGCYKLNRPLPTPNFDKLAADGIRFTNGFVTTPICAVSRASILTGRYSSGSGMTRFRSVLEGDVLENSDDNPPGFLINLLLRPVLVGAGQRPGNVVVEPNHDGVQ